MSFRVISFGGGENVSSVGFRHITNSGNGLLFGLGYSTFTDRDEETIQNSFGADYTRSEYKRESLQLSFNFRDFMKPDEIQYFLDYGLFYRYSSYDNNYISLRSSGFTSTRFDSYNTNGIGINIGFGAEYSLSKRVSIDAKIQASYSYEDKSGTDNGEIWQFRIGSTSLGINFYW